MKVSSKQYAQVLYKLTKDKSSEEVDIVVKKFVANLRSKQKLNSIDQVIKQFVKIYNKENSIVEAIVSTGREVDEKTVENIKKILKERYKAEKIEMEMKVDEKLKGGIKIMVEEDILDNSIAGKLARLRNGLVR